MNYGYVAMSRMLFLQLGFVWVIGCALLYGLAFAIGAKKGGHVALSFTRMLTIVFIGGMGAVAGLGYLSGDFPQFLRVGGFGSPQRRLEAIKLAKEAQQKVFKEAMQDVADETLNQKNL